MDQLLADEIVATPGTAGETRWALGDHLGSVRDLVTYNSVTSTVESLAHGTYDSFGNITSEQNAQNVDILFGYTGRPFDEATGLQNNLNRWLGPDLRDSQQSTDGDRPLAVGCILHGRPLRKSVTSIRLVE